MQVWQAIRRHQQLSPAPAGGRVEAHLERLHRVYLERATGSSGESGGGGGGGNGGSGGAPTSGGDMPGGDSSAEGSDSEAEGEQRLQPAQTLLELRAAQLRAARLQWQALPAGQPRPGQSPSQRGRELLQRHLRKHERRRHTLSQALGGDGAGGGAAAGGGYAYGYGEGGSMDADLLDWLQSDRLWMAMGVIIVGLLACILAMVYSQYGGAGHASVRSGMAVGGGAGATGTASGYRPR